MNVLDARQCLRLHSLVGLGDRTLSRLFLHYGSAANIWASPPGDWSAFGASRETIRDARALQSGPRGIATRIERQLVTLQELDAEVIPLTDTRYPALLQALYDPPPILYARGDAALLQGPQLGIVGSRKASPPGKRAAMELAGQLVRLGLHVTSGLAIGVDESAHRGALEAGGKTIAVMATGLDIVYPARHRALAVEIIEQGCLVTEFPPGCQPLSERFPKRNRIISGLSLGVLVVEAALRSGSLITARTAMEQGREVFALPWSIYHPAGKGCLALLRDGVKLVQELADIVDELGPLYQCQQELQEPQVQPTVPPPESGEDLLGFIGSEAISVDEIAQHSGLAVAPVLAKLTQLEVEGQIVRCAGGYIHC